MPKLWLSRFLIFLTLARAPSSFFPLRTTPRKESLRRTIVMNLIRLACEEIKEKLWTLSFNWIYLFLYSKPLPFDANKSYHYKQKKMLLDLITNFLLDFFYPGKKRHNTANFEIAFIGSI